MLGVFKGKDETFAIMHIVIQEGYAYSVHLRGIAGASQSSSNTRDLEDAHKIKAMIEKELKEKGYIEDDFLKSL